MKNSKKIAIFGLVLATTFLSAGAALAHGDFGKKGGTDPEKRAKGMRYKMEMTAEVLGVSVEELEQYKEDKVKFREILEEKGITKEEFRDKMMDQKKEKMIAHLQDLLDSEEITQEQFDEKMEWVENSNGHHKGLFHKKGFRDKKGPSAK